MLYFILPNEIPTLMLSMHLVTTLIFNSPIQFIAIGTGETDVYIKKINETTIALKSRTFDLKTNLTVTTKDDSFTLNLKHSDNPPATNLKVLRPYKADQILTKTYEDLSLTILKGEMTTRFFCHTDQMIEQTPCTRGDKLILGTRPTYLLETKNQVNPK